MFSIGPAGELLPSRPSALINPFSFKASLAPPPRPASQPALAAQTESARDSPVPAYFTSEKPAEEPKILCPNPILNRILLSSSYLSKPVSLSLRELTYLNID